MTAQPGVFLDEVTFQIRYTFGHTCLDRCGQTLVDIERAFPEWIPGEVTPVVGNLVNAQDDLGASFGPDAFTITARKPAAEDLTTFKRHASGIWKIVRSNLGLNEVIRVATRMHYLQPRKSVEDAEKAIATAKLNLQVPDSLSDYRLKIRQIIAVLERDGTEYRVELKGITRIESLPPIELFAVNPRLLSSGQNKARVEMMKRRAAYSKDPMYAVHLDVDCACYTVDPDIRPDDFISDHHLTVSRDFVPIVQRLTT